MLCNNKLGVVNISVGVFAEDIQAISPVDTSTTSETKGKYASWRSIQMERRKLWYGVQEVPETHGSH